MLSKKLKKVEKFNSSNSVNKVRFSEKPNFFGNIGLQHFNSATQNTLLSE